MTTRISIEAAESALNAIGEFLLLGGDDLKIQIVIFSGAAPSFDDPVDPDTNDVLAIYNIEGSLFGPAAPVGTSVEMLAHDIPMVSAIADGEASFFRIYSRDALLVVQGDVGEEMILNQTNVTTGSEMRIMRLVLGMSLG